MPVTNYVWDPVSDNVLLETDENDATQAVYTQEPNTFGNLISQRRADETSYYHFDGLGSTRELTNVLEEVTDTNMYDAWGVNVASTGTTENPFHWVGELGYCDDAETGDYYVRARMYQPAIGRWSTVEPSMLIIEEGLYIYTHNNPIFDTDPSGAETQRTSVGEPAMKAYDREVFWETVWTPVIGNLFGTHTTIKRTVDFEVLLSTPVAIEVTGRIRGSDENAPLVSGRSLAWRLPTKANIVDGLRGPNGKWNPKKENYLCRKLVRCVQKCRENCEVGANAFQTTEWTQSWTPWREESWIYGITTRRCRQYVYGFLRWEKDSTAPGPSCDESAFIQNGSWAKLTEQLCPASTGREICEKGPDWSEPFSFPNCGFPAGIVAE